MLNWFRGQQDVRKQLKLVHLLTFELATRVNQLEARMGLLDQLQADVAAQKTVVGSAIALLQGFNDRLKAAGTDAQAIQGLQQDLEKQTADLALAVTQNTPASVEQAPPVGGAPAATDPQQASGGGTAG